MLSSCGRRRANLSIQAIRREPGGAGVRTLGRKPEVGEGAAHGPSTSRSAPLAPSDTPVLCLREVSTASIVVPSRFIVAPPGRRHGRHCRLFEASPRTAAVLPLTSLDQSP